MSTEADARPVGRLHRVGPWVAIVLKGAEHFMDEMGMRTTVTSTLNKRQVF